jgi:hypothetical protein
MIARADGMLKERRDIRGHSLGKEKQQRIKKLGVGEI